MADAMSVADGLVLLCGPSTTQLRWAVPLPIASRRRGCCRAAAGPLPLL